MLPVAVGSLLGGLLGLLMVNQSRPIAVADRSVLALSESYNASGQDLFAQLAGVPGNRVQLAGELGKPGNIVFSPYSIGTAMALALSGARGETEAEMARVLRQQLPRAEIDSTNGKVLAVVGQYDGRSNTAKLITANAVLVQGSDLISNDYLARAKAHYAAEIFRNTDLAAVNNWVSQKTEGNVDKVIDRLDPKSAAVVLNAVYFKAQWRDPFDRKLTQTEAFAISPSQKMQVPMMRGEGSYAVVTQPGFSAIRLPYQSPQLHMVIVLPDEIGALHELNARLDNATLARLLSDLRGRSGLVDLRLPRFKARFEVTLKDHFRALGMTRSVRPRSGGFQRHDRRIGLDLHRGHCARGGHRRGGGRHRSRRRHGHRHGRRQAAGLPREPAVPVLHRRGHDECDPVSGTDCRPPIAGSPHEAQRKRGSVPAFRFAYPGYGRRALPIARRKRQPLASQTKARITQSLPPFE